MENGNCGCAVLIGLRAIEPRCQLLGEKCCGQQICATAHGRGKFIFLAGPPWRKMCTEQALNLALNNDFFFTELEIKRRASGSTLRYILSLVS